VMLESREGRGAERVGRIAETATAVRGAARRILFANVPGSKR